MKNYNIVNLFIRGRFLADAGTVILDGRKPQFLIQKYRVFSTLDYFI